MLKVLKCVVFVWFVCDLSALGAFSPLGTVDRHVGGTTVPCLVNALGMLFLVAILVCIFILPGSIGTL